MIKSGSSGYLSDIDCTTQSNYKYRKGLFLSTNCVFENCFIETSENLVHYLTKEKLMVAGRGVKESIETQSLFIKRWFVDTVRHGP